MSGQKVTMETQELQSAKSTSEMLLRTENVGVFYDKNKDALRNVNLDFEAGQVTALIGPSGCGKSTFLRCLNLMNREIPHCIVRGEIYFHGADINQQDVDLYELRQRIGMVFQTPNPFRKSIYENIAFPLRHHGVKDKKKIDEIIERSLRQASLFDEVKDRLDKSAYALSGGQRQRLCIARTLALDPEVVLMDEPCSALDPIATFAIEETINDLREAGICVIIVTHNIEQAARVSDKTAFFLLGDCLEWGDTEQVFSNPKNEKTQDYLSGRFG